MLEPLLKSIPIFSSIEPAESADLLKLLRAVALQPGQVLFRERTPGDAMWILGDGVEVSISATPPRGKRPVVIAHARAGESVGEMALIDDGPRSGTAVVMQGGPAHQIAASDFKAMRAAFHPVAYKILRQICKELCTRLRAADERIAPSKTQEGKTSGLVVAQRHATAVEIEEFGPLRTLPQVVKLALSQKLRPVHTDFDEPIFSEGEEGDSAYFLLGGEVCVQRNGQTLATLKPGAMFGLISVIDQGRRSASCVANGPARLLRLSKADFDSLFLSGNRFAFQIVDLASRQLVAHLRAANEMLPGPSRGAGVVTPTQATSSGLAAQAREPEPEMVPLELDLEMEVAGPTSDTVDILRHRT